jgi:serine/threonine-protein kinase
VIEIADRFDLTERIGGGATADVYRAYDHELDRVVVVRILRADVASDASYVERVQREAEAASGIHHPNIVEVIDVGVADGRTFVVRELVEGATLADLLARGERFPEDTARRIGEQLALGLAAAHARGILHRDLNAGNVFVTAERAAKIADFGVSTLGQHPAPEQVAGQPIDERADVYGLGAVLYQMLTGHAPRGRIVSPARLGVRVSRDLEAIVIRALATDPADRFPTAAAMAAALSAAAPITPVTPIMPVPPPAPSPRRRAGVPLAFLLALPLLLALLIAALTFQPTESKNTAVLSATTTPAVTASPVPTSLPPVETTPEPTSQPTPDATAAAPTTRPTLAPTAAAPAPPTTAPPAAAVTAQTSSTATVSSFYALINQTRYDDAAALWSPRMQAQYPPSTNINGRFDHTREIVVRGLAQVAEGLNTATVTVDLLEVLDSGVTRHWIGQWQLVWDGARWLMDAPNLRPA